MSIVEAALRRKREEAAEPRTSMRPMTVSEPDRTTFYCDVRAKRFVINGVKILEAYPNGDCRVIAGNGVQFTAKGDEIYHIRKGDYHEAPDL